MVINKDFDVRINSDDPFHILTVENQLRWKYPALADSQLGHSFRFVVCRTETSTTSKYLKHHVLYLETKTGRDIGWWM